MADWSLLDSSDPVLSLLGGIASGGRVGGDAGITGAGATEMAPVQRRTALDSLLASGAAFANAGAPGFGPRPTLAQGLTQGLLAGSIAGQAAQDHSLAQQQSAQVLAQAGRDADLRRQLMNQQLQYGEWARNFLKQRLMESGGQAPAGESALDTPDGTAPGMGVRDALRAHEQNPRLGYASVNDGGFTGAYQMGSQLMQDAGLYAPATPNEPLNTWAGTIKVPGFGDMKRDDFLKTPAAQEQAYGIMMGHLDKQLQSQGLYELAQRRMENGKINGVPVTREGLLAGAWLGGVGGLRSWLTGGGDPTDANHTRVSTYVRMGAGAQPAAGNAPAQPAQPQRGVQIAQGGATPIANDASGPPITATITPGAAPIDTTAPLAPVGGPTLAPAAPRGPPAPLPIGGTAPATATAAPASGGATGGVGFLKGATQAQLVGAMLSPDPIKALTALAGEKVRIEEKWNAQTGQMDKMFVNPEGATIGKFGSGAPKYEQSVEIGADNQAHTTYRIPGTSVVQQGGVVPGHTSTEKIWNPATGQMDVTVLDANRNPVKVIGSEKPAYRYQTEVMPDGQTYHTERIEGVPGYVKQIGPAPRDIKQVKEYDPANKQTLIWNLDANGNKQGTPFVSPELPGTIKEISGPNGNQVAAIYPGQPPQVIANAPLLPNQVPIPAERRAGDVAQAGATATEIEAGKQAAIASGKLYDSRNTAMAMNNQLNMLEAVSRSIPSGPGLDSTVKLGKVAAQLGLDLKALGPGFSTDTAVNADVFRKISNGLVLSQLGGEGMPRNNFSDTDLRFLTDTMPNLQNLPNANKTVVDYLRAMQSRTIDHANAWDDFRAANPTIANTEAGFRQFENGWSKRIANDPIVNYVSDRDQVAKLPPNRIWWTDKGGGRMGYTAPPPPARGY